MSPKVKRRKESMQEMK